MGSWGPPDVDEIAARIRADDPRRDRSINTPLECKDCGLLFEGDPKDPDCPLCESDNVHRRRQ